MIDLDMDVHAAGPVFDRRAEATMAAYARAAEDHVGTVAKDRVVGRLVQVIRQPTPFYWTQVISERQTADVVVHDQDVVYGPWLEGTGSRNRTTRFKGYRTFRLIAQKVRAQAGQLAAEVLGPFLDRIR